MTTNGILKRLCGNIAAGRFNWRKYCTPQLYFGWEICVTPLHCSYGQIGYTIHFPYTNIPEVEYDWELKKLQAVMFQRNTAISKPLWCVRFPNMQKPLMQRRYPTQKDITTPLVLLNVTANSFISITHPPSPEWAAV